MVFLVTLFIVYWIMYDDIMETGTVFMSLGLIMSLKNNLMSFRASSLRLARSVFILFHVGTYLRRRFAARIDFFALF